MATEKFSSPANRLLGGIGAVVGLAAVVAMVVSDPGRGELIAIFSIVFVVTLSWAYLVKPQIQLTDTTLTLRNPMSTIEVPLQMVMGVDVRRFTLVDLEEGRLTSPAMARGVMQLAKSDRGVTDPADTAAFMISRINTRIEERSLVALAEDEGVRRTPAWPEMALLAVSFVGLVVSLLL